MAYFGSWATFLSFAIRSSNDALVIRTMLLADLVLLAIILFDSIRLVGFFGEGFDLALRSFMVDLVSLLRVSLTHYLGVDSTLRAD